MLELLLALVLMSVLIITILQWQANLTSRQHQAGEAMTSRMVLGYTLALLRDEIRHVPLQAKIRRIRISGGRIRSGLPHPG
ncbi:MAG: hypothetical protein ACOCXA_05125, partial [Planctomycetota bacterium]